MFAFAVVFQSMLNWPFASERGAGELGGACCSSSGVGFRLRSTTNFCSSSSSFIGFSAADVSGPACCRWMAQPDHDASPGLHAHVEAGMGCASQTRWGFPWWGDGGWQWALRGAWPYWCTDFLLVQRAMAAKSLDSARKNAAGGRRLCPRCSSPRSSRCRACGALALAPQIVTGNYNLALSVS